MKVAIEQGLGTIRYSAGGPEDTQAPRYAALMRLVSTGA
jgi:hypothetical protein